MIQAGDFKNGLTFEINGQPHVVVEFQHVKPGKGAAFVRTKYKNLITGAIREQSFNPSDKFAPARVERAEMEYLYDDGEFYYVMDTNTYEQMALPMSDYADAFKFVRENTVVNVFSFNGSVFNVEPANFVILKITETEPGFKGNTATNTLKPAVVETGAEVRVPLFIEEGELIEIDTRDGSYMGRAKSYDKD